MCRAVLRALFSLAPVEAAPALASVRSVYLGSMGDGEQHDEMIRTLLRHELRRTGFVVTDSREEADAILTGKRTPMREGTQGVFKAVLDLHGQERVWEEEFKPDWRRTAQHGTSFEKLARQVAAAFQKAVRNAGGPRSPGSSNPKRMP